MLSYRTPGVYVEWLDIAAKGALSPVRTDVAAFVGVSRRGPLHAPVRVESWNQFRSVFGDFLPQGYLALAVDGFFANGGQTCWVVRVADPDRARPARLDIPDRPDGTGHRLLRLEAASRAAFEAGAPNVRGSRDDPETGDELPTRPDPGTWAHDLRVRVTPQGADRFSMTLRLPDGTLEQWRDLSMDRKDPRSRYVVAILNDRDEGSRLVSATDLRPWDRRRETTIPALPGAGRFLEGGDDGLASLRPEHLGGEVDDGSGPWGLATLETVAEVSLVAIPDIMPRVEVPVKILAPPSPCGSPRCSDPPPNPASVPAAFPPRFFEGEVRDLQDALIRHCERMANRMALLDPPPVTPELGPGSLMDPDQVVAWRAGFDTKFAAAYYPWIRVPDPFGSQGDLRTIPPSGHVAGVFARVEQTTGVHKPPANEVLERVEDLAFALDDEAHGTLNDRGINAIRAFPARGIRVAGARTLSDDDEWTYVNVRRLVLMVERAIDAGTQWIVFEPNNPALRIELDRVVRSFLNDLWRRGMLDGAAADEAYYVRCDETTNPPEEADAGRLVCEIGLKPPWPAEFVVVRIGKTEGGTQVLESGGVR